MSPSHPSKPSQNLHEETPFSARLLAHCQKSPKRLALPEGDDPRILACAAYLLEQKAVSHLTLYGDRQRGRQLAQEHDLQLPEDSQQLTWRPHCHDTADALAQHFAEACARKNRPVNTDQQTWLAQSKVAQACWHLKTGEHDGVLAGAAHSTADVIKAGLRVIGLNAGLKTLSSCFLMNKDQEVMLFTDGAVVIDPTAEQLVDIAAASLTTWRALVPEREAVLAFLSFSTKGSAKHAHTEKVALAARRFAEAHPEVRSDGELQFDTAMVPSIAERKAPNSPVCGQANLLVFPDLNAGNIGYKITQRLGGYAAYGPILQGFQKPLCDLSRGSTLSDIIVSAYLTLLQAT